MQWRRIECCDWINSLSAAAWWRPPGRSCPIPCGVTWIFMFILTQVVSVGPIDMFHPQLVPANSFNSTMALERSACNWYHQHQYAWKRIKNHEMLSTVLWELTARVVLRRTMRIEGNWRCEEVLNNVIYERERLFCYQQFNTITANSAKWSFSLLLSYLSCLLALIKLKWIKIKIYYYANNNLEN